MAEQTIIFSLTEKVLFQTAGPNRQTGSGGWGTCEAKVSTGALPWLGGSLGQGRRVGAQVPTGVPEESRAPQVLDRGFES